MNKIEFNDYSIVPEDVTMEHRTTTAEDFLEDHRTASKNRRCHCSAGKSCGKKRRKALGKEKLSASALPHQTLFSCLSPWRSLLKFIDRSISTAAHPTDIP
ncbi:unnamed protein product [Caenorhabditis auriculariae]|uniref:Uncharacterized protein n=1 Tax=Caenorhabditis auriculariae TaxID=2777116 RepID=A0A8S1GPF5_9PELO|nr:unnamed protein product [Caenorhabditis auriculariae]